jgi:hypothetical protein
MRPVLTEGGARVANQQLTEDANSYFLRFATQFSTHTFTVQLERVVQSSTTTSKSSSPSSAETAVSTPSIVVVTEAAVSQISEVETGSLLPTAAVATVMLAMAVVAVVAMRRKPTRATQ